MTGHIEDYEVLEVIGTSSFGTCYKVRNKLSGQIFVWKAIDYGSMTEEKKQLLVSEVNLLSELKHPHIVKYYDRIIHKESTTIYIIMEWCQGGDLATLIHKYKSKGCSVEEVFVWRVLYQTGRALQACHSHCHDVTVLHRDIKPANVFLDSSGNVKLGDFGLARILHNEQVFSDTIVGTPYYMSPEIIKGSKYDRKSDIWALGCLVYELCALSPPFIGGDLKQLATNIREGRFDPIPSDYSQDLQKIIELMLSVDHQFRPTIEMILHHPTVVLHVSKKSSFKFGNKRDSFKAECDKATLALVSEKIKTLSLIDREPEEVSEDTFHEKWMIRLEALRQREANLRKREDKLADKERLLLKKEKNLLHLERLSREKLIRAEVYLRQCKENKSSQVTTISKPHKYKMIEELDTSFSADPGDTSVLPTSTKLNPSFVPPPTNFVRSASERRCKHVHFDKSSKTSALSSVQEVGFQYKKVLGEIQVPTQRVHHGKALEDIQEIEPVRLGAFPKKVEKSSTLKPILQPTLRWEEERNMWLENKRVAYHSQLNKENYEQNQVCEVKEVKKRSSKLSLFNKKPSLR
ncbi:serine/threonine-protein kinase Nek2-like isoform X1 [Macrosteles quadrilineatus]|uniref:serine/threonine-protein kinase Nek2-like isoform X1 n=2 Tax=Macrosteles quadrilineatus TaxID=74068 RepID=UPI0023E1FD9E|nr:serine/threonine-protein kinase Nek2-like isoform X1 [Macrosteles quadrilineatus]